MRLRSTAQSSVDFGMLKFDRDFPTFLKSGPRAC